MNKRSFIDRGLRGDFGGLLLLYSPDGGKLVLGGVCVLGANFFGVFVDFFASFPSKGFLSFDFLENTGRHHMLLCFGSEPGIELNRAVKAFE